MSRIRKEKMNGEFTKYHINIDEFKPVFHRFTDIDRGDPHDHPWGFTTHILKGGYVEKVYRINADGSGYDTELIHRRPGTVHEVKATHIHQLVELPEGECWTIVIPGPWERESRFWRFDQNGIMSRAWNERKFTPLEIAQQ